MSGGSLLLRQLFEDDKSKWILKWIPRGDIATYYSVVQTTKTCQWLNLINSIVIRVQTTKTHHYNSANSIVISVFFLNVVVQIHTFCKCCVIFKFFFLSYYGIIRGTVFWGKKRTSQYRVRRTDLKISDWLMEIDEKPSQNIKNGTKKGTWFNILSWWCNSYNFNVFSYHLFCFIFQSFLLIIRQNNSFLINCVLNYGVTTYHGHGGDLLHGRKTNLGNRTHVRNREEYYPHSRWGKERTR